MIYTVFYKGAYEDGFYDTMTKEFNVLNEAIDFCNEKRAEGQSRKECCITARNKGDKGYGFTFY